MEVLGGGAWIPTQPPMLLARSVKCPISSYHSDRRGKAFNILSVATELFILCLIVIQSILCGQVCDVLSGQDVFHTPTAEFLILLSQGVQQALLLPPQLLLGFLTALSPAQEHWEGQSQFLRT